MDLSAVVVNWNSGRYLARLMDSLLPLLDELRAVWVVDNASRDGSAGSLPRHPRIRLLQMEENRGFAVAANRAILRCAGRHVLLLNPDVEVNADTVRRLWKEIEEHPGAAIVCGSLRDAQGRSQESFQIRDLPTWRSVLGDALFLDELLKRGDEPGRTRRGPIAVEQPAAAFWMLRKEAWASIGGFDARFFPAWFEDVDFCRRLRDSGWEVLYYPELPVLHGGGISVERMGRQAFLRAFYGNLLKYLHKHHPLAYPLLWLPVRLGLWMRLLGSGS